MAFTLTPDAKFLGFDDEGEPLAGGKLNTYVAGTSTPLATYIDSAGTANTNPVILDSAGRATVYLGPFTYKFVLTDANDVAIWTQDNVSDAALVSTSGAIVGTTDVQTLTNKTLNVPTINFGTITSATIVSPIITNPNVSTGSFSTPSIGDPIFTTKVALSKRLEYGKGANVTPGATIVLGDDGNVFAVSGLANVDTITTTNWQAGSEVILIFTGVTNLNHGVSGPAGTAPMLLINGSNYSTTANTVMRFVYDGANWQQSAPASVNHL